MAQEQKIRSVKRLASASEDDLFSEIRRLKHRDRVHLLKVLVYSRAAAVVISSIVGLVIASLAWNKFFK